jgi:hypothetical protein
VLIDWAYQGATSTLAAVWPPIHGSASRRDIELALEGRPAEPFGPWDGNRARHRQSGQDFLIHEENRALYTAASFARAYAQLRLRWHSRHLVPASCASAASPAASDLQPSAQHMSSTRRRGERNFQYTIYTISRPKHSARRLGKNVPMTQPTDAGRLSHRATTPWAR